MSALLTYRDGQDRKQSGGKRARGAPGGGSSMGHPAIPLKDVSLDYKYDLTKSNVCIAGTQAIVRRMLMQRERDRRMGLHTAVSVSGYRGSPLGGLDQQFERARRYLDPAGI